MRIWRQYVECGNMWKRKTEKSWYTVRWRHSLNLEQLCSACAELFSNCKRCNETGTSSLSMYLTSRRAGLPASAELLCYLSRQSDTAMLIWYFCPPVALWYCIEANAHIVELSTVWQKRHSRFFWSDRRYKIPQLRH